MIARLLVAMWVGVALGAGGAVATYPPRTVVRTVQLEVPCHRMPEGDRPIIMIGGIMEGEFKVRGVIRMNNGHRTWKVFQLWRRRADPFGRYIWTFEGNFSAPLRTSNAGMIEIAREAMTD